MDWQGARDSVGRVSYLMGGLSDTACVRALLISQKRLYLQSALECAADSFREPYVIKNPQAQRVPVPVDKIASSLGFSVWFAGIKNNAIMIPGLKEIKLRSNLTHTQQRFAIAHELGHTLFFAGEDDRGRLEYIYQEGFVSGKDGTQEVVCDMFARELLMPLTYFLPSFFSLVKEITIGESRTPSEHSLHHCEQNLLSASDNFGVSSGSFVRRANDLCKDFGRIAHDKQSEFEKLGFNYDTLRNYPGYLERLNQLYFLFVSED